MRHTRFIALLAIMLPLGLGGCDFGGEDTEDVASPTPTVVPTEPVAVAPNTAPDGTAAAPANAPNAGPAGILPPDLISSTDPAQRVQSVQRNRPDPFALIPTTPTVQIPPTPAVARPVPQLPNLPPRSVPQSGFGPGGSRGSGSTASRPSNPTTSARPNANRPGSLAPIPQLVPENPVAFLPPPPPQPTLAQAVKVTGVVQIGSTVHAIVNAPNEPSSRYVRVGQRLSNGQVLVKRIEMNQGSEPVVVLEQNGVEVQTAVGEGGPATEPTAASAIVPSA